jgi:hypothetical protein
MCLLWQVRDAAVVGIWINAVPHVTQSCYTAPQHRIKRKAQFVVLSCLPLPICTLRMYKCTAGIMVLVKSCVLLGGQVKVRSSYDRCAKLREVDTTFTASLCVTTEQQIAAIYFIADQSCKQTRLEKSCKRQLQSSAFTACCDCMHY